MILTLHLRIQPRIIAIKRFSDFAITLGDQANN